VLTICGSPAGRPGCFTLGSCYEAGRESLAAGSLGTCPSCQLSGQEPAHEAAREQQQLPRPHLRGLIHHGPADSRARQPDRAPGPYREAIHLCGRNVLGVVDLA